MPRTFIRQDHQIRNSDVYDDTVSAGSTLESAPTHIEDDLNGLRSQMKRAIYADSAGDWFADIPTVNSKKRGISALNTDLDDIEEKRILFREVLLTDITVPASQNYVVLTQASSETPSETAAAGAGTAEGAVVAVLGTDVGSHSLDEVAGPATIKPKNLCVVRDASTGQPLQSGGKDIYALIQAETGVTDGDTFNDTDKQVQLSFVIENGTGDDLIACPVVDIENEVINYSYVRRVKFDNLPEYAFLSGAFIDEASTAELTLNTAIDNQSGAATQTQNIDWQITDTFTLDFQDSTGGVNLLRIAPNVAGDEIEMNIDTLDINNTNSVDIAEGLIVDSAGTAINLGVTAGQIDSAGALTLASAASGDLTVSASGEIVLTDTNKGGSTFAGALKLSETSTEWDNYETVFGEVSLLNAIYQARTAVAFDEYVAVVTTNEAADTNMTGAGGTPNLDAQLGDYSAKTFTSDVQIYVNGVLQRKGADATANHDVYPGDTPANGDLKFEFNIKADDVITMVIF